MWQTDAAVRQVTWELRGILKNMPDEYSERHAPRVDKAYWMLNLLCHRRDDGNDVVTLCEFYRKNREDFRRTCETADGLVWDRLRDDGAAGRIRIEPVDSAGPAQRLRPFKFELKFDAPDLASSYLVTNILQYRWRFKLTGNFGAPSKRWTVTVNAPRITQFAPFMGQLSVHLTIIRPGGPGRPDDPLKTRKFFACRKLQLAAPAPFPILDNDELTFLRRDDKRERFLFGLVLAIALLTALPTLYLEKPTFGSLADYIAILIWAIGIDQAKNIVQLLNSTPDAAAKQAK